MAKKSTQRTDATTAVVAYMAMAERMKKQKQCYEATLAAKLAAVEEQLKEMAAERDAARKQREHYEAELAAVRAAAQKRKELADEMRKLIAAEVDAAEEELKSLAAERDAAEESRFRVVMGAISATAVSDTDYAQRSWQAPVEEPDFLKQFAEVPPADVQEAWKHFCDRFSEHAAAAGPSRETRHLHPVLRLMLEAVLPTIHEHNLQLFCEKYAHDVIPRAKAQPDFIVAHVREAQSSLLGSVVMVETRLTGVKGAGIVAAERQSRAFGRRCVQKNFDEARSRGEPGNEICSVVAGTDGRHVTFSRVVSGAPPAGVSFKGLVPCPATHIVRLGLFPTWNGVTLPPLPETPPAGFDAFMRVLHSPIKQLSGQGPPLASLNVRWTGTVPVPVEETLTLGTCLGHGGTSDAYSIAGRDGSVIKTSRCVTVDISATYEAEIKALHDLADTAGARGLVPTLLRSGERIPPNSTVHPSPGWLVLELSPVGVPLELWLLQNTPADPLAAADRIVSRIVAALACAHETGIIHCDVRPSNVIMAGGLAVLVDWGVSRSVGADCACVGVPAYVVDGVLTDDRYVSRPSQDLVAAAYLWLSIAVGGGRAPWQGAGRTLDEVIAARAKRKAGRGRLAAISTFIHQYSGATSRLQTAARRAATALWPQV